MLSCSPGEDTGGVCSEGGGSCPGGVAQKGPSSIQCLCQCFCFVCFCLYLGFSVIEHLTEHQDVLGSNPPSMSFLYKSLINKNINIAFFVCLPQLHHSLVHVVVWSGLSDVPSHQDRSVFPHPKTTQIQKILEYTSLSYTLQYTAFAVVLPSIFHVGYKSQIIYNL